jgi:hypothetical protein
LTVSQGDLTPEEMPSLRESNVTDPSSDYPSLLQRLTARLRRRATPSEITVDYDALVGVEHDGQVVLLIATDGSRRPITFATVQDATAWFGRAHTGLLARREERHRPPELARLGDALTDLSTRPWSTPAHLASIFLAGLARAAVSGAILERGDRGLAIRCHRFGRLHLGGTIAPDAGRDLMAHLSRHLNGAPSGRIMIDGRFPGPPLEAHLEEHPAGLQIRPHDIAPAFADLAAWGAGAETTLTLRDILSLGPGMVLIAGRSDSGKSTLAQLCEVEARALRRPDAEVLIVDEIKDREAACEALERAEDNLVIATLRAEDAEESIAWLRSLRIKRSQLSGALKGVVESRLVPVQCDRCHGEACERCHRSGVSHRQGTLRVARLASMFQERDTVPPFERERRKLTA